MAINPEWVTLPLNERADLEANAHTEQADRLAEFINKRVDAINQPSTNDSFNRVVMEALKQPDIDSFLLATKDNSPYDEKTLTSIYVDATEGMKNNKELVKSKQLISDTTIDNTFGAETANALLSAVGRVPVIGGNLANLGVEGVKSLQKVGLTSDDWNAYQGIAAKEYAYKDAADALATEQDPNKQKILQERMAKNSPDTYTAEQKAMFDKELTQDVSVSPGGTADLIIGGQDSIAVSKIDKIKGIEEVTRGQEAIRDYSKAIDSLVNRTKVEDMVADTKRNFNNSEGIIEAIAVAGEAIVNNPGAIFQSAVQSVPDIALAATSFGTSIAANFQEKTMEARDIYKQTYGKDATGDADNQLMATAFLAGLVDSGADRFLIKGFKPGTSPAAIVADSKILGDGFTKAATTQFLKITQAGAAGTVTEFGAEAGGEALTQLAGKQGGADIDWAQSFAEGTIGAGSGGAIATGAAALKAGKEVTTDTAQKMAGRVKAKEDKDISSLVSNPATMDIPGASRLMTSIISDPNATPEQKVKAVSDMEKAFDLRSIMEIASKQLQLKASSEEGITEAEGKKLTILESRLKDLNDVSEVVKSAKDSIQGISVERSIDVLTSPEINEDGTKPDAEISRMAINKVLSDALDVNTQFTTEHAKNILDTRTDLTEDQRMNLRTFMEVNSKMDALQAASESGKKTTGQVREDVFNGGKGFIGAKTYVSAILGSIKHKQDKIAESLFSELETFSVRHTAKAHALNLINDSFINGHGMSAELQNTVMQAAVPGIKFKPFTRAQPYVNNVMEESVVLNEVTAAMRQRLDVLKETKTASVPVSTVAESQTEATVDTQPQAEPTQQPTEVETTNRASEITASGNLTQPVSGTKPKREFTEAEKALLIKRNPTFDGTFENEDQEVLMNSEDYGNIDEPATFIDDAVDSKGNGVALMEGESGAIYVIDPVTDNILSKTEVVGEDGVVTTTATDARKRGLATLVTKEHLRRNPNATTKSFSEAGAATYLNAAKQLEAEKQTQPSKREGVSPERETEVVTGTVTDEVLNEGVATEQAEGGILNNLMEVENYPNVVAKYLQVKSSKKKTPLVAMKDFMGKLSTDLNSTVESIIGRSPEGEESLLVNKLLSFSTDFKKSLLSSVVFNPQYATQNPISYFVDTTGNLKAEVADALSVVSFNWLAENATDTLVKTDDQIGAVLGLELEDRKIHSYVYQTVGQAGVPFNEEVVNIGNEVIKTLGLQVNKETGGELHHTFIHELAISMGIAAVTAMRAMQDTQGNSIVNEVVLTAEQRNVSYLIMSEGLSLEQATKAVQNTPRDQLQFKEDLRTIKVDFITDSKSGVNKPSDHIQGETIGPVQAAGSFLQELFGTLKATKMPTFKPVKVGDSDVLMKRTDQILPQKSIDLQNKQNSTPNYFKKGFARLFGALPLTEIAEMFDFDPDVELTKHVDNVESAKSVNNLIMLELGRVYDFHMQYTEHRDFVSKGYDLPFYLSYENNRVFRVQTQQNVMNAQSNKLTRHVMYKGDWNQSYSTNPSVNPQAALAWELAVAQAFGIGIDKQYPEVSQKQLQELMGDADIAAGIEAASWIDDANEEITTTQWTDIKNAVAKLGKTTAAMDGLLALGAKLNAERNGELSFQSDIGIEFDGVTNGPMLVLMQYANFDSTWAAQAEAGGIYVNSEFTDTVTAKLRGVLDRYQQAAVNAASKWERTDSVSYKSAGQKVTLLLSKVKPALDSIYGLLATRDLEGNYTIPSSARNLMKGIVTPLGYQSSAQAAQRDFGNSIVDKLTDLFERTHAMEISTLPFDHSAHMKLTTSRESVVNAINSMAPGFIEYVRNEDGSIEWLKTKINVNSVYKFDSTNGKVSMTLPEYLGRTYGSVLTDAVTELSQSSEAMRADVVQVTNLAVAIYEITRQQLIDEVIATKGSVKGKAKLLTTDEMNAIDEKLKAIHPEMATAISSELGKGISILKTKGTTAQQVEVKVEFAKAIPTKDVFGNSLTSHKTSTVRSTPEVVEVPGVSAVPNQTLATDASILTLGSLASTDQEVLHDASINSPVTAVENMRKWNDAFYRVALNHSIPVNTAAMANRIFDGVSKLIPSIDFTYAMTEKYKLTALFEGQDKAKPLPTSVISSLFQAFTNAANLSFTQKKEFFAKNVITINHYAAPDAEVTYHNGVKIDLDSMTTEQVEKEFNVQFKRINQAVKSAPQGSDDVDVDNKAATPNTTNISTPSTGGEIPIHAPLVKEFERKNNVLTLEQALSTIDAKTSGATMAAVKSIITKMLKQSSNDLKVVMYNEANTYAGDLAWISSSTKVKELAAGSRGLYIPAGVEGNTSPYILLMEGTDATNSGVTQETLMHEVLHHIFDGHLSDANSVATKEITKLMESVRKQLTTYKDPKVLSWIAANSDSSGNLFGLTSPKEFLAWGLSNQQFQNLLKATSLNETEANQLRTNAGIKSAWKGFVTTVKKVLFGADVKSGSLDNTLQGLLEIVGSIGQTNAVTLSGSISRQQVNQGHRHDINKMNSIELFNRMKTMGHTKASTAHSQFLGNVLESVVNVALTPLQVILTSNRIGEAYGELTAADRLEVYTSLTKGTSIQGMPNQIGFNKSVQESYVYGLTQAVLDEVLAATSNHSNAANKLFNIAKQKLTYLDFMEDPTSQDPLEIEFAQRRYDSVFDVGSYATNTYSDTSSGLTFEMHKSHYLRNFLALAATNEQFREALSKVSIPESTKPETLFDKLIGLITDVFNLVLNKATGVNTKENLKVNLDRLTAKLVTKHLESQSFAEKALDGTLQYTSFALGYAAKLIRKGIVKVGDAGMVRNSKYKFVRTVGGLAKLVGNERTEFLFKAMDDVFSQLGQGKQGMLGEIATEVKGTTKDTTKVHTLLRIANHVLDRGRKQVIETAKKMLISAFHRELSQQEKVGLTKFLLRTDAISLNALGYTQDQLADLIDKPTYRAQEIARIEGMVNAAVTDPKLINYYLNQAEELGFAMVNGFSSNANMVPNAYAIANVWGMSSISRPDEATVNSVIPLIDGLASIHAIQRTAAKGKFANVANLIREEHRRTDDNGDADNNGITFLLYTHQQAQAKTLKENFGGNPALMRKGYMPSITNPYLDVQVGYKADTAIAAKRGYTEMYDLENDPNHHMAPQRAMYLSKAGGLAQFTRGAFSTTQNKTIGFKISDPGDIAILSATAMQQEAKLTNGRVSPLYSRNPVHAQAIFNEDGNVIGYRYVMAESTKDNLLERNDDFSEVLAKHTGNVYDKAVTKPHNQLVVETLKEQYDIDMAAGKGNKYIRLSLKSDDPELVELYKLLPDATREHIKKVFGTDSIPVRAEFLRVIFGFRNIAITDLWTKEADNGFMGTMIKGMFETIGAGQGMVVASHFERALKDMVRVAKTNLVIRTGLITAANAVSNTYDLLINGLTLREAMSWQADGYKYGIQYIKLTSRTAEINMLLEADHNPTHRKRLESEKAQLMQLQATNPAARLIEAGLLQTIVLEVDQDIDPFSMTSRLSKRIEEQTSKLPQSVQDIGKFAFMTRDSQSFEVMNRLVQFGDFAARYAMYKKITTRKDMPMNHVDAIQKVITHFVNYDLPTHRLIQYGNDMGFIWFSRYWLRIQKVILTNFAENPGRVLTGMMLQGMLGVDVADTNDSSVISTGVLHPFGGFDRVASGLIANPVLLQ